MPGESKERGRDRTEEEGEGGREGRRDEDGKQTGMRPA